MINTLSAPRAVLVGLAVAALAAPVVAQSDLAAPLCDVLKSVVPATRGYKPEGARAQLVMAVAEKFDYDAARLRRVKAGIDAATSGGCPKEREAMLAVTKTKTLSEAVE